MGSLKPWDADLICVLAQWVEDWVLPQLRCRLQLRSDPGPGIPCAAGQPKKKKKKGNFLKEVINVLKEN